MSYPYECDACSDEFGEDGYEAERWQVTPGTALRWGYITPLQYVLLRVTGNTGYVEGKYCSDCRYRDPPAPEPDFGREVVGLLSFGLIPAGLLFASVPLSPLIVVLCLILFVEFFVPQHVRRRLQAERLPGYSRRALQRDVRGDDMRLSSDASPQERFVNGEINQDEFEDLVDEKLDSGDDEAMKKLVLEKE